MTIYSENYKKHTNVIFRQNALILVLNLVGVFFKRRLKSAAPLIGM
jgi:hypothetical protein